MYKLNRILYTRSTMRKLIIQLLFVIFVLASCLNKNTDVIEKKVLFHLAMGKAENEIDLIQLPGIPFQKKSRIVMKNGLFFISNGNTGKIMEFTSYGDIINLYYNDKENPEPIMLSSSLASNTVSNRKAFKYPFKNIGEIEVTNTGELLVDDKVSAGRVEKDDATGSVLNRIVLRFSKEGNLIGYLGQEGPGGTPFPYIEKLEVNSHDDIIVFTRTAVSRIIFWFNSEGTLLYKISINLDDLPLPEGTSSPIAFLDTLTADRNAMILYVKIDYYVSVLGVGAQGKGTPEYKESKIWEFSVPENTFTKGISIPPVTSERYGQGKKEANFADEVYQFLGCDASGKLYLLIHYKLNTFQMLFLSPNGTVLARRELMMDDQHISYSSFYLTKTGLLTALLGKENDADVVWWRSDKTPGVVNVSGN